MADGQVLVEDTLTLRGKEIKVRVGRLPQAELLFFPENPRVYSLLRKSDAEPSQREIEDALREMDHVKLLVQSIKANGGLTDPLLVRGSDKVVLEGNSRLAAYRILAETDPIKWGEVKCKVLPGDVAESDIFAFLGQYHIVGRQDWQPFEQAGYLYRRHKRHGVSAGTMAGEVGLSTQDVTKKIETYEFMVRHGEEEASRWSYWWEYLRHRAISKARETYRQFDELVVGMVKRSEIPRAMDIREKLAKIASKSGKVLKDVALGKRDFDDSYERAVEGGAESACYQRLKKFRLWVVEDERREELKEMPEQLWKHCEFELKKIRPAVERLLKTRGGLAGGR